MSDLIEVLFSYSERARVPSCLQSPEYQRAVFGLEEHWDGFRATLTKEQEEMLDSLLSQELKVQHLEDRAAFQAALSIGLDLGRLHRGAAQS